MYLRRLILQHFIPRLEIRRVFLDILLDFLLLLQREQSWRSWTPGEHGQTLDLLAANVPALEGVERVPVVFLNKGNEKLKI